MKKFPGRGGGKKCAESFGVSPQQWSPWERGMRTPDELRLSQIAKFFGVTVEYLRRDQGAKPFGEDMHHSTMYRNFAPPATALLQEPDAPPYGLPPLRREERQDSLDKVAELAAVSSRILDMVGSVVKGVSNNEYDIGNAITVLRTLGFHLNKKLAEAENRPAGVAPQMDQ